MRMREAKKASVGWCCGRTTAAVIGSDFTHSPIANHRHPKMLRSIEQGRLFAKHYVLSFNVVQAAEASGIPVRVTRGTKKHPRAPYKFVMTRPLIRFGHFIDEEMKKMAEIVRQAGVTPEQVVEELTQIAFNSDGEFCGNEKLKVTTDHKLKALDMLAKYLGLYEKDNKQKVADTQVLQIAFVGADYVEQQMQKAAEVKEIKANSVIEGNEKLEVLNDRIKANFRVNN